MAGTNWKILAGALIALVSVPVLAQQYSDGFTMLKAVRERDGATVERLLSNPSSTVANARDSSTGEGVLHILVRGRDLTWLAFMLGRGARPDMASNDGSTPLILAALLGWRDGAEQLLARGANPNLGDSHGETPLIVAVQHRDIQMVRLLMIARANPDQTDNVTGNSAMDYARQDVRAAPVLREIQQALARRQQPVAPNATAPH